MPSSISSTGFQRQFIRYLRCLSNVFYACKMRRFVGADGRRREFGFSDIHALDKMCEQGNHLFNRPIVYSL